MSKRRVKLYALNSERQWDDRGTGHVTSSYIEKCKGIALIVRGEADGNLLLESKILPETVYQKQQGTLIVWSEGENYDLALSFQEKVGCEEIWERICQVQGKDPSVEITHELVEESEDERFEDVNESNPWVELPICELSKLEGINEAISSCLHSPLRRERLAMQIENESYIKKLISLFNICEDLENMEGLHLLYEIFKNIFLLNKNSLFEIMFADDMIMHVVGAMEYDPASPCPKKHRQFLKSRVRFKEVIPIENTDLLNKIHQTYRLQYIQDVVLPPPAVFEENLLSTLSSFVFLNKVEIVSQIQDDDRFLTELFHQLSSAEDEIDLEKRRDLVLFLKELCTFSQTLQPSNRDHFFKTLSNLGVLYAMEITLCLDDSLIKSASIDILSYIVEFSPSMVREYMMQQQHKVEEEQYLLNIVIEQMVLDSDPEMGGAVQLMGILRIMIDPENMMTTVTKSERSDFLVFFYKHSMHSLVAPLLANTVGNEVGREDFQTAQLLALILELLSFCVEHHTYHIKNYIVQRDLLNRILVLMKSKHKFLVLSALRFMRKIIGLKDDFYTRHIVNSNLFEPVVDAFVRNNGRYNLLDSAIIEMFDYIRSENLRILSVDVVEKYGSVLSKVDYVKTFRDLQLFYDQIQDRVTREKDKSSSLDSLAGVVINQAVDLNSPTSGRFRRDAREMEFEEERWFGQDDDQDDLEAELEGRHVDPGTIDARHQDASQESDLHDPAVPATPAASLADATSKDHISKEGEEDMDSVTQTKSGEAVAVASPVVNRKVSLVDYDENSDDDEEEEDSVEESPAESHAVDENREIVSSSPTQPTALQDVPEPSAPVSEESPNNKSDENDPARAEKEAPDAPGTEKSTSGADAPSKEADVTTDDDPDLSHVDKKTKLSEL